MAFVMQPFIYSNSSSTSLIFKSHYECSTSFSHPFTREAIMAILNRKRYQERNFILNLDLRERERNVTRDSFEWKLLEIFLPFSKSLTRMRKIFHSRAHVDNIKLNWISSHTFVREGIYVRKMDETNLLN